MKDLVIVGTGGVGKETALIVEDINEISQEWNLLGFIDDNKELIGKEINGYKVLGDREFLNNFDKEVYVVIAIADHCIKEELVKYLTNKNIQYATLIHPSVKINRTISIGKGCIIYQNVIMTVNINIGNHVIISPKCGIGHDSLIEDYVTVLWNVNISGSERIRQGVTLGSGCTIIQGLEIGRGSFVGAGAVVIRDIDKSKTAVGVPTRYVGE
ncbi:MAG: acetyltransferase [Terrisporobacter sp.]|uniref:acetyltransferase n=1 Tax=Terrisporobacter sp. TaxID=1965305 RepID=UPI0039A09148